MISTIVLNCSDSMKILSVTHQVMKRVKIQKERTNMMQPFCCHSLFNWAIDSPLLGVISFRLYHSYSYWNAEMKIQYDQNSSIYLCSLCLSYRLQHLGSTTNLTIRPDWGKGGIFCTCSFVCQNFNRLRIAFASAMILLRHYNMLFSCGNLHSNADVLS